MNNNSTDAITNNGMNHKMTENQSNQNASLNITTITTRPNSKLTSSKVLYPGIYAYSSPSIIGSPKSQVLANKEYMLQEFGSNMVYQGTSMTMPQLNRELVSPADLVFPTPDLGMLAQDAVAQDMILRYNMQMGLLNNVYQNDAYMEGYQSQNPFLAPSPLPFHYAAPRNIPFLNGNMIAQYRNFPYYSLPPFDNPFLPLCPETNIQALNATLVNNMKEEERKVQEILSSYTYPIFLPMADNGQAMQSSSLKPSSMTGGQQNPGLNVNVTVNVKDERLIPTLNSLALCQDNRNSSLHQKSHLNQTNEIIQPQSPLQIQNPLHDAFSLNSGLGSSQINCISTKASLMGKCDHCNKLVESTGIKVICADCEREEVLIIKEYLKNDIFNECEEEEKRKSKAADKEKPKSRQKVIKKEVRNSTASLTPLPPFSTPIETSLNVTAKSTRKESSTRLSKSSPGKHKLDASLNSIHPLNSQGSQERPAKKIRCSSTSSSLDNASFPVSNIIANSKLDEKKSKKVVGNVIDNGMTSNDSINDVEMGDEDMRLIGDLSPPSPTNIMESWNTDEDVVSNTISDTPTSSYFEHKDSSKYNACPGESSPSEEKVLIRM